jgi:zinc/manganese transport system ATP-binding protein
VSDVSLSPPRFGPVPLTAALRFDDAALRVENRTLWSGLTVQVRPGEFLAVLGANGSGKTSLLRAILGLVPLTRGTVLVDGHAPAKGREGIGYVPQQRRLDPLTPMRARDLVALGLDGHRWGIGRFGRPVAGGAGPAASKRSRVEAALSAVGALPFADAPVGRLSGGEQQRVRIAQALVSDPRLLLCDEPLLSLDLGSQQVVTQLVDQRRRSHQMAVVFVTHEINPVLPYVDRVLYLANGQARVGSVDEVMNSTTLSELYGAAVEVIRSGDRILVAGIPEAPEHGHHDTDEGEAFPAEPSSLHREARRTHGRPS